MEVVDKLNKRKEPLNKKTDRYEKIDGEYCQYVHVCIMNDKNEFLIQKRSPYKKIYPNPNNTNIYNIKNNGKLNIHNINQLNKIITTATTILII